MENRKRSALSDDEGDETCFVDVTSNDDWNSSEKRCRKSSSDSCPETMYKDEQDEYEKKLSSDDRSFWSSQILVTCESLIWSGNLGRLERFIWALPDIPEVHTKEVVRIAKAFVAYKQERYEELYDILKSRSFSKKYHSLLQVRDCSLICLYSYVSFNLLVLTNPFRGV